MVMGGTRVKLLGILWGVAIYNAEGEVSSAPIPTVTKSIAISQIPSNVGFCVKAEQLMAFEKHFAAMI